MRCEPDGVELIGHRGAMVRGGPAENTIAAVDTVLAAGADGVEVDVRLTADGVAVCLHDPDLLRVAGSPHLVRQLTYDQLRRVPLLNGDVVPRLDDVAYAVRGRGLLIAEAKHDPAGPPGIAESVVAVLRGAGLGNDVVLSSFSEEVLNRAREVAPRLRRGLVTGPEVPASAALRRAVVAGHCELHAHIRTVLADHEVADRARGYGCRVRCWTVNREVDARLVAVAGVTSLITDDPTRMRSAMANRPLERSVP